MRWIDIRALEIAQKLSVPYPESLCRRKHLEMETSEHTTVVFCTLALHHFSDDDAVRVLNLPRALAQIRARV